MEQPAMRRRPVPAVTRAVAILRHLGRSAEPLGVNAIARSLGLVPSTCLHILRVLADEGLVAFDEATRRYRIDVGILPIARDAIRRNGLAALAEPRLTRLSTEFGVTALATQLADAEHMVVVALSNAALPYRLAVDLGSRFPALISATGRCHAAFNLAHLAPAELRARFDRLQWDHAPDFESWFSEVGAARRDGHAVDRGRYISGVTILAVPLRDAGGGMTHSVVVIGIGEQVVPAREAAILAAMHETCDEMSALMGPGAGR